MHYKNGRWTADARAMTLVLLTQSSRAKGTLGILYQGVPTHCRDCIWRSDSLQLQSNLLYIPPVYKDRLSIYLNLHIKTTCV